MSAPARMDAAARDDNLSVAERHTSRDIPALDGLRGLAVLLVIWAHIEGISFTGPTRWIAEVKEACGFIGLYLFFCLSGFLLFLPYAQALVAHAKWPDVRRFYNRRMLRILPVYYSALLVPIVVTLIRPDWHIVPPIPSPTTLLTIGTLLHNVNPDAWAYILGTNTPLWSLSVEWEFYLILPLLALGLRALASRFGAKGVICGLLGLMTYGLVIRAIAAATFYQQGYPIVIQVPGPIGILLTLLYGMNGDYLELFALGMLACLIYVAATSAAAPAALAWARNTVRMTRAISILTAVSLLVGIPLYIVFLHVTDSIPTPAAARVGRWPQEAPFAWTWSILGPWLLAIFLAVLLIGAIFGPAWLNRIFSWRPLRLVGLISYSLYVWHILFHRFWGFFLTQNWGNTVPAILNVGPYLLILLGIGIVSYRFIERPFLQMRKGRPLPILAALQRLTARRPPREQPKAAPATSTTGN